MPIPDGVSWQEGIYGCPGAIGERLRHGDPCTSHPARRTIKCSPLLWKIMYPPAMLMCTAPLDRFNSSLDSNTWFVRRCIRSAMGAI